MRNALVVRGGWEGHQPKEATDLMLPFLKAEGFEVRVENSTQVYSDEKYMATVDLIIQSITSGTIEESEADGLVKAVERGTGFAGWHGGVLATFKGTERYAHMIGAVFVSHPGKPAAERIGETTDGFVPHTYHFTSQGKSHEITQGIEDFELDTEQYWLLHDPYLQVLATTTQERRESDPWHQEVTSPAIWTRLWGKGRIFVISIGHDVETLLHPTVSTIIQRGALWAARP